MSIRRLGKNAFIRLGDRWFGIQHIEWIRFDEKTLFSSKSVTVNLREVRNTYEEGSDEYKFFRNHFEGKDDGMKDGLMEKKVGSTSTSTAIASCKTTTPSIPSGGMPTYSASIKKKQ